MIPILPVRQKPHFIAQPTCVDRQKVFAGVSGMKTDSMSWPSSSRSRNLVVPSEDVLFADDVRRRDPEGGRQTGAQLAPQVGHPGEIGHAALVHPLEDLPPMKPRMSHRLERLLELGELHFREIVTNPRPLNL